jgi:hypothetical protein
VSTHREFAKQRATEIPRAGASLTAPRRALAREVGDVACGRGAVGAVCQASPISFTWLANLANSSDLKIYCKLRDPDDKSNA